MTSQQELSSSTECSFIVNKLSQKTTHIKQTGENLNITANITDTSSLFSCQTFKFGSSVETATKLTIGAMKTNKVIMGSPDMQMVQLHTFLYKLS